MFTTANYARNIGKRKALREYVSLLMIKVARVISAITKK